MTMLLHQAGETQLPTRTINDNPDAARLPGSDDRATEDAATGVLRELNVSLTALAIYIDEIKKVTATDFSDNTILHLQSVVADVAKQTARAIVLVKQLSDSRPGQAIVPEAPPARHDGDTGQETSRGTAASSERKHPLTGREAEVLALIAEGYSNKEGALQMNISWRTFESHRANIIRKLNARNTADLIRKALRMNIDRGEPSEPASNPENG